MIRISELVKDTLKVRNYINELGCFLPCSLRDVMNYLKFKYVGLPTESDMYAKFNKRTDKGLFGKMIEYAIFGQKPNGESVSDLPCCEIKTCALKKLKNGNLNAKERQTLGNCGNTNDYATFSNITENAAFSDCIVYKKCKRLLFFIREDTKGKNKEFETL